MYDRKRGLAIHNSRRQNGSMRLKQFTVAGLFGLFDHVIPLRLSDRITIIHAPNGYGKTVILKLIANFFGGSLAVYRQIEFERVLFEFDDDSTVTISQRKIPSEIPGRETADYIISFKDTKGKTHKFDPSSDRQAAGEKFPLPDMARNIERYVPFLTRIGPIKFRDVRTNEVINLHDAIERYAGDLPDRFKSLVSQPQWLKDLRDSIHCRLIETQRLMVSSKERTSTGREESALIPAVKTDSAEMGARIRAALAESATLSQALDRTFPNRLLLSESLNALTEAELRKRLASLEQHRTRLTDAGLLDKSDDSALIPEKNINDITRRILTEYVNDAEKKLKVFDALLARIELLVQIINKRFQFKSLSVSRDSGFVLRDIHEKPVNIEHLSSGEQHELVLVYDLLFNTKVDTLLLIDEPEISLHVAWQKKFLADLRAIIELTPMDIVLSTHSPQLIGGNIDLATQLKGPRDGR